MGAWPAPAVPPLVHITPWSHESCGALLSTIANGIKDSTGSATWAVANSALYVPFAVYVPTTFVMMYTLNGSVAAGNIDVGIYSSDGTQLVHQGSTAQSGTGSIQTFNITDITLQPGTYFMALAASLATTTFGHTAAMTTPQQKVLGIYEQATAFPLPATATFATMANFTRVPAFGLMTRATI